MILPGKPVSTFWDHALRTGIYSSSKSAASTPDETSILSRPPRTGADAHRRSEGRGRACLSHCLRASSARAAADAADARAARGTSLGPLDGVLVSIKDLFDVAGEVDARRLENPCRRGRAGRGRRHRGAAAARRRRVIVAKTNMTEFAFSGIGANPHFGTPGNPHDRKRVPGGSSSGAPSPSPTA